MNIITTKEQLAEMVEYYLKQDAFAFDTETVGQRRGVTVVNEIMWISFATQDRKSTRLNSIHIPLSRMPSSA